MAIAAYPRALAAMAFSAAIVFSALATAQTDGQVRSQGRVISPDENQSPTIGPIGPLFEPREEMRKFIQNISTFARRYRRNFTVITQNGLALLTKSDSGDETQALPARTYMRSIDGVLQEAMFYGLPEMDKPTTKDRRDALLNLAGVAKKGGVKVLVLDYAKTPKTIDAAYRASRAKGLVGFVAPAVGLEINAVPRYPRYPAGANSTSIISLKSIKNFLYIRDSSAFGRQDEFALKLHGNNFDAVVVDIFRRIGEPLSKRAVETLKFKKLGARRLVLAYLNIGAAESHRSYWKSHWREGSPLWISAPYPGDADKYFVEFWRPEWRNIINGNADSYIYGIVKQGFDGVVLDGVDAYRYFEGGMEAVEVVR
ncbi:MAG: endo alpha-1,4 polygalactosaminidase [Rhodospirillales bacterium]|nr:endo alpha-1,4 polygalactosaminidase [Rhodospirillales bacterium]